MAMHETGATADVVEMSAARVTRAGEILELVRRGEAETTSELAGLLGVARSTINDRISQLIAHDLLRAVSPNAPAGQRGRPATRLQFNPRAGVALAVQLGLSGARTAVTDLDGVVLASETGDIDLHRGPQAVLDTLISRLENTLAALGHTTEDAHGIGIGLPSRIELARFPQGTDAAPGSWSVGAVKTYLSERLRSSVHVDHDVSMLAFGEQWARTANVETLIGLKAGTVIGCGIVVNGAVLSGVDHLAGEIGHTRVGMDTTPCVCGNLGCLNAVAGGGAIARRLSERGFATPDTRSVVDLANAGNVEAAQEIRDSGRLIGEVLAGVVNLLNPAVISVWGYLSDTNGHLFAGIQEGLSRHALPGATPRLQLEPALLGDEAGILGAAMRVTQSALAPSAVDEYLLAHARKARATSELVDAE